MTAIQYIVKRMIVIKDTQKELAARVADVAAHHGLSQRALAREVGVSSAFMNQVLNGKSKVSADILVGIADRFPEVSRDWLLTGEGEMKRSSPDTTPPSPTSPSARLVNAAKKDMGLEEIATLAQLGKDEAAWEILKALLQTYPDSMSLEELSSALPVDLTQVHANVALLKKMGSVEESEDGRLRLSSGTPTERLVAGSLPDRYQGALAAAEVIFHEILPAVERKKGSIRIMEGRTTKGYSRELLGRLLESVTSQVNEAGAHEGESESFTVIIAVAENVSSE